MLCLEIISYSYVLVGIKLPVGGLLGIYRDFAYDGVPNATHC